MRPRQALRPLLVATAVACAALTAVATPARADGGEQVQPLPGTHAHNDYEHPRPLFDALDRGFTSIEVDVWAVPGLVPDKLLVAHDPEDLTADRTLEDLYLQPLAELVAEQGAVYPGHDAPIQLLVDVKSGAEVTYALLEEKLARYAGILTRYEDGKVVPGAVTAVVSGNRDIERMAAQEERLAFLDTRVQEAWEPRAELAPLVSENWTELFTWDGTGEFPAAQRAKLDGIVARAHANGQQLRFWSTPDTPVEQAHAVWTVLLDAGVDYIGTDDLDGLRAFLLARTS